MLGFSRLIDMLYSASVGEPQQQVDEDFHHVVGTSGSSFESFTL
jgi:hypothetical protein